MPTYIDRHPLATIPRAVQQQMHREALCGSVDPHGVQPLGHWVTDRVMYCVLRAPSEEAVRRYYAERGLPCDELRPVTGLRGCLTASSAAARRPGRRRAPQTSCRPGVSARCLATPLENQPPCVPQLIPTQQVIRHAAPRATKGSVVPPGMDGSRALRLGGCLAVTMIARTAVARVVDHVRSRPPTGGAPGSGPSRRAMLATLSGGRGSVELLPRSR